ncbi:MAG: Ribonuclease P protein component [Candidatus Woesebacteria bacterium GW2011_GWC2_40_30]|nr:MAG: Ribonuclease P protein component [Candidatus Woesebacteria bacterium GW2011_GWC2_40_30]
MLAKKFKLTGAKDYARVQTEGKVFQSDSFGIAYVERGDSEPSKFGFIVSTKIAKDAVDRNRFKRAMSEAVRIDSINLVQGYDVVFLAKTSIYRVSTTDIMKENIDLCIRLL